MRVGEVRANDGGFLQRLSLVATKALFWTFVVILSQIPVDNCDSIQSKQCFVPRLTNEIVDKRAVGDCSRGIISLASTCSDEA